MICNWLNCCEEIKKEVVKLARIKENYENMLTACESERGALMKKLEEKEDKVQELILDLHSANAYITELEQKVAKLEEKLKEEKEQEEQEAKWEKYWNNRHPKQHIEYSGRSFPKDPKRRFSIDVRYFFAPSQPLYELVEKNKLNTGTYDERALKCLKWVMENFKYQGDKETFGSSEYWAFPCEALYAKKGDCDDGAILLANLMLCAGIPYWRIRLNAGDVKGGGHAYVTYCRETDNQFVVLDWCYWPNTKPISERPLHKEEQNYYGIWFSWNQKYAFGRMETMARMPDHFKPKKKRWARCVTKIMKS